MNHNDLQNKIRELRDLINSSICYKQGAWDRKDDGDWSKLWTAVDNVEDTQSAIEEYSSLQTFSRLAVYGLLQAMVVQQDAIAHLENAIKIKKPDWKKEYAGLSDIRKIRVETVGHPISEKGLYTSISRTNNLEVLEYGVWSKKGFEHKTISLKEIIKTQHDLLIKELDRVIKKIKADEAKHRKKHGMTSLAKLLDQTGYHVEKLWSFETSRDYSRINLKFVKSRYEEFKKEIKKRYKLKKVDEHGVQIPGLVLVFQKVDKLFPRIEKMIPLGSGVDEFELDVYVESLDHAFQELRVMAKKTDEEFGTKIV